MSVTGLSPDDWEWRGIEAGRDWLVSVQLRDGEVYVESGPADPAARAHESVGGIQSFQSFLESPAGWVSDYPVLAAFVEKVVRSRVASKA
jgi:hypothetical protein